MKIPYVNFVKPMASMKLETVNLDFGPNSTANVSVMVPSLTGSR